MRAEDELIKAIRQASGRYSGYEVYSDWVALSCGPRIIINQDIVRDAASLLTGRRGKTKNLMSERRLEK